MRRFLLPAIVICIHSATTACGQEPNSKPDEAKLAKQRGDATIKLGQEHAADYTIYRNERRDAEFRLHPTAILRFTNPVPQESGTRPQELYGGVFLWLKRGRPEVVVSVLKVYSPGTPFVLHELTSLSDHRVVAAYNGARQWYPNQPGITPLPVPNAPRPAETARGRLAQMRAMSRQFAANKTDRKNRTTELRLLSKPLYRYVSSDPSVTDGALFAFVDGTDPEVLLLLETRRGAVAEQWNFATARLNQLHLKVVHQARTVWQAPALTRNEWKNREAPYSLLRQPARQPDE